ncbi:MAG: DNA repair protein RecO, partial [Candidatus Curtissbacteria bacterium]|nr:DNA repair protein RecO [Candidatus Curtissbacteria bacterium]
MKTYKTEGIVLKRSNFGEADRIVTIFSKHFGKIKVLAKGIRKTTSRKGGNLELFNWVRIFVACGKNLDIVTEAETVKAFRIWRRDLRKVALAYHFCELTDKLTAENVPHKEIFDLLV